MKRFKKKTLALVLASAITVVGSFAAEHYKNTLKSVKFKMDENGIVNMEIQTKSLYNKELTLSQKDANTYVLILPETNSDIVEMPNLNDEIYNIDISTLPYTTEKNGYTKITVNTDVTTKLLASSTVYLPKINDPIPLPKAEENEEFYSYQFSTPGYKKSETDSNTESDSSSSEDEKSNNNEPTPQIDTKKIVTQSQIRKAEKPQASINQTHKISPKEIMYFLMGFVVLVGLAIFIYNQSKVRMRELIGEQTSINVDDEDDTKTLDKKTKAKNRIKKINNTINNLDKQYNKSNVMPLSGIKRSPLTSNTPLSSVSDALPLQNQTVTVEDELNIIDMDELFQEAQSSQQNSDVGNDENEALEDFLSAYTFSDDIFEENTKTVVEEEKEEKEEPLFDNELFEKCINNHNLNFSKEDLEKINSLLLTEINNETLKNIEKYAISNPIKNIPTKQERLENIVTSYAIKQNITFSSEDINILNKLLCVEIDNDFLTNLKTNPKEIERIQNSYKDNEALAHKKSEIITLGVKDMLPNLSEALKKHGNKRIESNYKPDVVYFKEGYDVSTLAIKESMPDLSIEINNKDAYKTRPSDAIQFVESGYDVETMTTSGLPDLQDVIKNPEKYIKPEPQRTVVDEDALLNNISNVTFKPFYDGSEPFEIINDFEENNNLEMLTAPSITEMQKELEDFGDLKIINEEHFESIYETQQNYQEIEELNSEKSITQQEIKQDIDQELEELINTNQENILSELENLNEVHIVKNVDSDDSQSDTNTNSDKKPVRALDSQNKNELLKLEKQPLVKNIKKRFKEAEDLLQLIEAQQNNRKNNLRAKETQIKQNVTESVNKEEKITQEEFCIIDGIKYNILDKVMITENISCILANSKAGFYVLGHVDEKMFTIKHYEKLKAQKIQARVSDKINHLITRYIVKVGLHKFIINVTKDSMEYVMDLC